MRILLMSLIFGWVFSCQESEKENKASLAAPIQPTKPLQAAFLVVDGVYNSELIAPMDVFQHTRFHTSNAIEVFTIAPQRDTVTTFEGLKIIPDYGFDDNYPAIDILVVPSAEHSMDTDLENEKLLAFVTKTGKQALYTFSLCDGAFVLAEAKLLDTYQCTTFPGDIAKFKRAYPQLKVHENVSFVHDRKSITSAGGAKSYDAALYMVELLYGKKVADGIAKGLVIEWNIADIKHIQTNR